MQTQPARYYASEDYILPADAHETRRLNLQHAVIVEAFENRLSLAPLTLKPGDRVLESAAGTGIWASEFFAQNDQEGVVIECIDISDKQYPKEHPPQIRFSVHSVADLPMQWTNTFVYVHQRLLVAALNDAAWRTAIKELFRVLEPGGWLELVELEIKNFRFGVGQYSRKLYTMTEAFRHDKSYIGELPGYLPAVLKEAGFVDISCETRHVPIGLGAGPN